MRGSKRKQIFDAAVECFATTGYHAVTISDLARHAGISKGLMYNYFASKDELLKAIFNEIMTVMIDLFDPDENGIRTRKDLIGYLDRFFLHLESNLMMWKMYMAIFCQPAVQEILKNEILDASQVPLKMIVDYFKKEGYKNPKLEVAFLSTLSSGIIIEYIGDPDNYPLKEIKKRILSLYSNHPKEKKK